MNFLSLFAGIAGFDLGLERAGLQCGGQVEINDYCNKILEKHYPGVRRWKDIKDFNLMLLQEGFHAKTFHLPERAPEYTQSALYYGGKCYKPFAWWDQNMQLWRTWQRSLTGEWVRYSEAWPKAGMIRNGIAYRLHTWEPPIKENGSSLWPTPQANDWKMAAASLESIERYMGANHQLHWPEIVLREHYKKMGERGQAHPEFAEWLMGFPTGWTESEPLEMQSSHKSQNTSEGG